MNTTPIIALGTPFGAWDQLVAPLAFGACQEKFVRWHDERSRDILALPKGADFALREFPADILAGLDGMLSPEGLLVWEARAVWTLDLLIQKLPTAL